ncbi:MAG: flagellar protein FlgN [Planctomycetota bacterium]
MDKTTLTQIERLTALLDQCVERQGQLLSLLKRKRDAMRRGEDAAMADLTRAENAVVQAVSELEKSRLRLIAELTQRLAPTADEPLRMRELAERLPEPWRGRVLLKRQKLVEAITAVRDETSVVRRAGESLVGHVNGLIRTIGVAARGGAAYGQSGRLSQEPARMGRLDIAA